MNVGSEINSAPGLARRHRRPALFTQADINRALRAARQVGADYGVRVEPDGAIVIGRLAAQMAPIVSNSVPVRDFTL